jgi:hypothetical protein
LLAQLVLNHARVPSSHPRQVLLGRHQALEGRVFEPVSGALRPEASVGADGWGLQERHDHSLQRAVERSAASEFHVGLIEARFERRADPHSRLHVHRVHGIGNRRKAFVVARVREQSGVPFGCAKGSRRPQRTEVQRGALPARDGINHDHETPDEVVGCQPRHHPGVLRQRARKRAREAIALVESRKGNRVNRRTDGTGAMGWQQQRAGIRWLCCGGL